MQTIVKQLCILNRSILLILWYEFLLKKEKQPNL